MIYSKLLFVFFVFIAIPSYANDIKIIELHKSKTLDQLVLDTEISEETDHNDAMETLNTNDENEIIKEDSKIENSNQTNDVSENTENTEIVGEEPVTIYNTQTIFDLDENILNKHLDTITKIQSKTLHQEFIKILSNIQLDEVNIPENKVYLIIKKLYEIGEIEKAYNLVKKINLNKISKVENLNFFYFIELNYLYSSFRLSEVCELKSILLEKSIILPKNLLEKTDIFCLTLENKYAEARLLNSLLLESENEIDQNFQNLFNYMILSDQTDKVFENLSNIKSNDLIFLYSAMLRINELPLGEDFIEVDPLNLSIPVILSESTKMDIRIKAANKAYYDNVLSINSLSALYQSVDFNSKQFANPEQTIASLKSDELKMAYYYQLASMQIFPDERLDVIIKYWNFAIESGLEKIAYEITAQIMKTFNPTSKNAEFAMQIALANIANNNYDEALKWINLYEVSGLDIDSIDNAKFLIDISRNNDLETIKNYFSKNYINFDKISNQHTLESIDVLVNFLNVENILVKKISYDNILDIRSMPSYFLIKDINNNIDENNDLSVFLLALISMNNKKWIELHPEHLKLILISYNLYENGSLIKNIILEVLKELEVH